MPVIIFDRDILSDNYTARIGVDNVALGRAAARHALNITPAAPSAVEIYGLPGSTPAEDRHRGFADEFTARGRTLAASAPGNWNPRDARRAATASWPHIPASTSSTPTTTAWAIAAAEVADNLGIRNKLKIVASTPPPPLAFRPWPTTLSTPHSYTPTDGHRLIRTARNSPRRALRTPSNRCPSLRPVDPSNADILPPCKRKPSPTRLARWRSSKSNIDAYWARHSAQTTLFYACIVIIVLLVGLVFLVLRAYWRAAWDTTHSSKSSTAQSRPSATQAEKRLNRPASGGRSRS